MPRVLRIIFHPDREWDAIAGEPATVVTLLFRVIVPLCLIPAVATAIGIAWFGTGWDPLRGYALPRERALAIGVANFLFLVLTLLALGLIFHWFTAIGSKSKNAYSQALKVAAYGAIPVLLSGAFLVFPVMAILVVVACLHSLFLYNGGLHRVLGVSQGESPMLLGIAVVALSLAAMAMGAAVAALGLY